MRIGIHSAKSDFSDRWITYCVANSIEYKIVDCYKSDIIIQLSDCDALMWHFQDSTPKDFLFAKQLLFALQANNKVVFPDFWTSWHFDDKLGQKYLLESIGAPLVTTYLFYSSIEANAWLNTTEFPKVFKLRGGAGSRNVKLIKTRKEAHKIVRKVFSKGFPQYDPYGSLKERYRKFRLGKSNFYDLFKGMVRFFYPPPFARMAGREKGYAYFQDFIPNNDFDIRVIVIDNKAFAIKRMVRKDDFRASGSGNILYEKKHFDEATITLSFELARKLKSQSTAFDFVYKDGKPLVVEISYGFVKEGYDPCPGYWDCELTWHEGPFNPYGWMVDTIIKSIKQLNGNEPYTKN